MGMSMTVFNKIEELLKSGWTYAEIEHITGYSIEIIKKVENWRNQVKTKGADNE